MKILTPFLIEPNKPLESIMTQNLYPLTFEYATKNYIWGGRNFEKIGRTLFNDDVIAECWDIAAHPDGQSMVNNGIHAGKTLTALHNELGIELIGTHNQWAQDRQKFPLLIKLLDANRNLSVQVHPRDLYALANEGNELGKTEMWVVLDAKPDARVIIGVKEGTTPEIFQQAIIDGNLENFLHCIPVKVGDFVTVPAGSVHAICSGIMVAEIQQNSNTTYRVYDWNRMGKDGKPRPLHVEQAMEVIDFAQVEPALPVATPIDSPEGSTAEQLWSNEYFTVERIRLDAGASLTGICDGSTFEIFGAIEGCVTIESSADPVKLTDIQFSLLPATLGQYTVTATTDTLLLRVYVKEEKA